MTKNFTTEKTEKDRKERQKGNTMTLLYEQESYSILGACFEVYKDKGCGFVEAVYQECLELELSFQKIPFVPQSELQIAYKGHTLKQTYKPDFVCFGKIIVEIKAVSSLDDEHRKQIHNYLKATSFRLGFLVNFAHHPKLEYERVIR
jgi:GxxExxY protein